MTTLTADTLHWKRNLFLMWFSQLLVLTGFAAVMPFIPLFLKESFHITNDGERGTYVAMFSIAGVLGYAIFNPIWGALSDRFGVRPMLLRGTFVTGIFFPLMGFVHQVWLLVLLRFISAACAGTTAASQTLLVKNTPEDKQGFALGTLSTAVFGGSALGNMLGGMMVHYYGYTSTFVLCGALYFVAGFVVLFAKDDFKPEWKKKTEESMYVKKIRRYRNSPLPGFTIGVWLLLLLFLAAGFVRTFDVPYFPMLVELITEPKETVLWITIISTCVTVGALVSGAILGYVADRVKPFYLIIPVMLITVVMLVIQGMTESRWVCCISRTLLYIFAGGLFPVLQKLLSCTTPKRKRGSVFGWSSTASNVGNICSTVVASWVLLGFGVRGVFYAAAVASILFIPLAIWIIRKAMSQPFYQAHSPWK